MGRSPRHSRHGSVQWVTWLKRDLPVIRIYMPFSLPVGVNEGGTAETPVSTARLLRANQELKQRSTLWLHNRPSRRKQSDLDLDLGPTTSSNYTAWTLIPKFMYHGGPFVKYTKSSRATILNCCQRRPYCCSSEPPPNVSAEMPHVC